MIHRHNQIMMQTPRNGAHGRRAQAAKMNSSSFNNKTINLSTYSESNYYLTVTLPSQTYHQWSRIYCIGDITINSNSVINGKYILSVMVISTIPP